MTLEPNIKDIDAYITILEIWKLYVTNYKNKTHITIKLHILHI